MVSLINRELSKVPGRIAQILIYIILSLFMFYILCFFLIAIGDIAATSGLYNSSPDGTPLHEILENFPINKVDISNTAGIVIMLFLWLLLLGIFKAKKGIVILPFQVDPGDKNFNGNAISEMLIAELKRIIRIHSVNTESNRSSSEEMEVSTSSKNLSAIYPIKDIKEKAHLLQLSPKGENLDQSIQTIGTLAFNSTSIPIGSVLVVLRDICPGADPGLIISGCLQKSESDICLISYMKRENRSWHIRKKIKNSENISNEDLSVLVSELSYNIYYELLQLQSKQNISDALKHRAGEPPGKAPNHDLPSWEVLNYFTEAMAALQTYNTTKERKDLDRARVLGLKAASVDPYYNNPLYLLYNVGIAYLNNLTKKDYYEAERLARYIVGLRPDSSRAWYSWGLTLTFLILNEEAIECYNKALFFDKYEKEEKDKIEKDIKFMRAISLRDMKRYDDAQADFDYFLHREYRNGYAWGHYGIMLEAKAKLEDKKSEAKKGDELRDEAEKAFQKAILNQPDFVSVHAALARIYRKKYVLSWEKIPYNDGIPSEDGKNLKKFILKNFHFNWLNDAVIKNNNDKNDKIEITKKGKLSLLKSLSLELSGDKTDVFLKRKIIGPIAYPIGRYAVKKEYVFRWREIPGTDDDRLKEYLGTRYNFDWLPTARFVKSPDDKTIYISPNNSTLSLMFNNEDSNVILEISKILRERFIAKEENVELNIYKKKNDELKVYLRDPSKECDDVRRYKQKRKLTEYNRACYEINCENEEMAHKLLEQEINQNQVSEWLEEDPDWNEVRDKEWFTNLLAEAKKKKNDLDIDNLILRKAVRRKLDMESGKNFNQVDDPDGLKKVLKESFLVRARFHAASGKDDNALNLLYWALKYKQINAEEARFEPDFEFIRDKPRFKEMMERFSESERVNS